MSSLKCEAFHREGLPAARRSLILALSGLVAFGFSASALRIGLDSIGFRYLAATIAGYVTFLLLIRVWIALHRIGWRRRAFDGPDLTADCLIAAVARPRMFGGGHSGGAAPATSWGIVVDQRQRR